MVKVLTLELFDSFEFECVCFCVCLLLFPSVKVRQLFFLNLSLSDRSYQSQFWSGLKQSVRWTGTVRWSGPDRAGVDSEKYLGESEFRNPIGLTVRTLTELTGIRKLDLKKCIICFCKNMSNISLDLQNRYKHVRVLHFQWLIDSFLLRFRHLRLRSYQTPNLKNIFWVFFFENLYFFLIFVKITWKKFFEKFLEKSIKYAFFHLRARNSRT